MTRAALLFAAAACAFAFACSHEASTLSGPPPRDPADSASHDRAPVGAVDEPVASDDDACIHVDSDLGGKHVTVEGRLFVDDAYEHPTRGKTHPYILRLDEPRCATGAGEARVTELHLASVEGVTLRPLIGKHVRISGDPFSAHTAWHARPVVLMTTKAVPTR